MIELLLQILLSIVSFIGFAGGTNLILKGIAPFLPQGTPPAPVLDNNFRFLVGIYFSMGFMLAWAVINIEQVHDLIYFLGIVVTFAGLGRLFSRIKVGSAGTYYDTIMILEIVLGMVIIALQYFR